MFILPFTFKSKISSLFLYFILNIFRNFFLSKVEILQLKSKSGNSSNKFITPEHWELISEMVNNLLKFNLL